MLGIDERFQAEKISDSRNFRAIRMNCNVWVSGLDESAIWQILRHNVRPDGHDKLPRHPPLVVTLSITR